ncbi:hypothetical protein NQ315_004816 [Exocentrus adspersus]|uniref:Protein brambleberry n=1 Tax=Exocentrus adspersus TaxID=1586481 RepID=A0AAV8W3E5_9CUCU|nr:hypothetical protein NQ315_004816 [Exocentrus adspersus]
MQGIVYICIIILCLIHENTVKSGFVDYISSVGNYFGLHSEEKDDNVDLEPYNRKIPYEVSTTDEKFLNEAAKLTGVALSELDFCQQRVVLKLKSDCDKMNDETLAKMAVHLLNCQSFVEGRQIFPCTEEMSIKDCTIRMDSDTWTSYHLMSNRVRAVCYNIRQIQFRGLAEYTVNRLMDVAKDQLKTLGKIASGQESLKSLADTTYVVLNKGHQHLAKQQENIQRAQFHGQLAIEDNIKRLTDEKRLISDTHKQLIEMTQNMQNKLGYSLQQLDEHNRESEISHQDLIEDVVKIEGKVQEIFKKIEQSSDMLLKQNEYFKTQYGATLKNLQEVNETVHSLVVLVGSTRKALEDRLTWITTALGGTDLAVERLYIILWHSALMLISMLACAFLSARESTRLVVVTLPPLNLFAALFGDWHMDPVLLMSTLGGFIAVQTILLYAVSLKSKTNGALQWPKQKNTDENPSIIYNSSKEFVSSTRDDDGTKASSYQPNHSKPIIDADDKDVIYRNEDDSCKDTFHSLTPPVSRNGYYNVRSRSRSTTPLYLNTSLRSPCHANTRTGTRCKLSSLPGRDYCYRHQSGDSIIS